MAETRAKAAAAFDAFIESYQLKYEKAAACLAKDHDALLAFYEFPASAASMTGGNHERGNRPGKKPPGKGGRIVARSDEVLNDAAQAGEFVARAGGPENIAVRSQHHGSRAKFAQIVIR